MELNTIYNEDNVQGLRGPDRAKIPEELCNHITHICEEWSWLT